MVEFGAPLRPTLEACKVLGLDFICNTDHSYDLDDKIGSWFETDPNLIKWKESREEISKIKGQHSNKISELLGYISKSEVIHKDDMVII